MGSRMFLVHHPYGPWKYLVPCCDWPIKSLLQTFLSQTNKSCRTSKRTLALLNSLCRSTLVRPIAVSHTVSLNEDKFLRFLGL
jgi:hypothetical protein